MVCSFLSGMEGESLSDVRTHVHYRRSGGNLMMDFGRQLDNRMNDGRISEQGLSRPDYKSG
jgi:hypothetical protein